MIVPSFFVTLLVVLALIFLVQLPSVNAVLNGIDEHNDEEVIMEVETSHHNGDRDARLQEDHDIHFVFRTDEEMNEFSRSLPREIPADHVYFEEIAREKAIEKLSQAVPSSFFDDKQEHVVVTAVEPTLRPTRPPTTQRPTRLPTFSVRPTRVPTFSVRPSMEPTEVRPSMDPTERPSRLPTTIRPSREPTTIRPTREPTFERTFVPTREPTIPKTRLPTFQKTVVPTREPTIPQTRLPTFQKTVVPTREPTIPQTRVPTIPGTNAPNIPSTNPPTIPQSRAPTVPNSGTPTVPGTNPPTIPQSRAPTIPNSNAPVMVQTQAPTVPTTGAPVAVSTHPPTSGAPFALPTQAPTVPSTLLPTRAPTVAASAKPTNTGAPSVFFSTPVYSLNKQYFNGSYHMYYNSLDNAPSNYMTISLWVNTTTKSTTVVSMARTPSNYNGEFLLDITSTGKLEFWEYNNGYGLDVYSNTAVTTGKRTHIAFVKNNTRGSFYINGKLDSTGTTTFPVTNKNLGFNVGNDPRNKNRFFKGWMDNLNVYNFPMGASEVANMYNYFIQPPTPMPTFAPTMYPTNPTYEPTRKPTAGPTIMPPTVPVVLSGVNRAPTIGFQIIDAMAAGDATQVSGDELRRKYMSVVQMLNVTRQSIISSVFTNSSTGKKYTSVTWNPGHDSAYFTIADAGNTHNLFLTNYDYSSSSYTSSPVTLAAAGFYGETARYTAFGNNPFAVPLASDSTIIMKNVVTWLNKGVDPTTLSSFKVTIAHLPGKSSYWFSHDIPTHAWFASSYPKATVNAINACDNGALDGCLVGSNLLVIGLQIDRIDDTAVTATTTNVTQVSNAVRKFMENGGAVMYVHYYRVGNKLTDQFLPMMGLSKLSYSSYTNYWRKSGFLNANPFTYVAGTVDTLYNMVQTLHGITPLATADVCTTESQWTSCSTNANFNRKIKNGVDNLRTILGNFDNAATDIFSTSAINKYVLEKMLILLGDKYRTATGATDEMTTVIKYPLAQSNWVGLAQFMFADSSILYSRKSAPAQDDLGSVYCSTWNTLLGKNGCSDYKNFADTTKVTRYNDWVVQDAGIYPNDVWTTTGVFAIPGVPFTVTRLDDRADITLYVALWYQRSGTTKSLDADSSKPGYYQYHRPQYMRSPYVLLTKDKTITITSPTGGPIYFGLVSSGVTRTSTNYLKASFSNVARHPSILDVGVDAQVNGLVSDIKTNPIPIVDIKAPGMELHMRSDYLLSSLKKDYDFMVDYSGDNGMKTMLYDLRYNFLEPQMTLAGFKAPGKLLTESLPQTVQTACKLLTWNCTDTSIHQYSGIQHANYDERATCGNGCSGNPFDMDWTMSPLGWGESHELGHNMQQSLMSISWVASGASRDLWSNYQSRAGENSNNIFPYHNKWRYYRIYKNYNGTIQNSRGASLDGFLNLQSAYSRVNKTVSGVNKQVIFDSSCAVAKSYPLGTQLSRVILDATYADSSYAADNNARMDFYLQIPMIMTGKTVVKGKVTLTNGYEMFTLIYQGVRTLKYYAQTDARWKQYRSTIGFNLFNRTCASTDPCYSVYGTSSVTSMSGNDYMLVMLTYLTGYDFRPYFNLRGLPYSWLAEKQVVAHVNSGVASKGLVPLDYYAIKDYPPADIIGGSGVKKIPIDGSTGWPFSTWSPSTCAAK